jgi:hypothetical protein
LESSFAGAVTLVSGFIAGLDSATVGDPDKLCEGAEVSVVEDSAGEFSDPEEPEAAMEGEVEACSLVDSLFGVVAVASELVTEFVGAFKAGAFARLSDRAGGSFLLTSGVESLETASGVVASLLVLPEEADWRSDSFTRPELRSMAVILLPLALPSSSLLLTDLRDEFVLDGSGTGEDVAIGFFESTTPLAASSAGSDRDGALDGGVGIREFEEPLGAVLEADELLDGRFFGTAGFCAVTGRLPVRAAEVLGDLGVCELLIGELLFGVEAVGVRGAEPFRLRVPVPGGSITGATF